VWSLRQWRRRRILRRAQLPEGPWLSSLARVPGAKLLSGEETARLRELVILFLHEKHIEGVQGMTLDDESRLIIAAHACLPILNLGLDWYSGWVSVVVYPAQFLAKHEYVDDAGVAHVERRPLSGESWLGGPVILSWLDVVEAGEADGYNVVIHEFAHKLDMRNGDANGYPPLHRGMERAAWAADFTEAYEALQAQLDAGEHPDIDPYAAESPAEFFAVTSEIFFEAPDALANIYPKVYRHLSAFYRQDRAGSSARG
jgi:Mlc titration factor MtfA (ptsG expression regulator)